MKLKDSKISKQINISVILGACLVLAMGTLGYYINNNIAKNLTTFHDHPFATEVALSNINQDVLEMRLTMEEIVLLNNSKLVQQKLLKVENYNLDAKKNIKNLYESYLGPKSDVDNLDKSILSYEKVRESTLKLIANGEIQQAKQQVSFDGACGVAAEKILNETSIIAAFADKKADNLYINSMENNNSSLQLLIIFLASIFILMVCIIYFFRKKIITPIKSLTRKIDDYKMGLIDNRDANYPNNELGFLANSFEEMTKEIDNRTQENIEKAAKLLVAAQEISAQKELVYENEEKAKRAEELAVANEEKAKRADELAIANIELAYQNDEKEKRAKELLIIKESLFNEKQLLEKTLLNIGDCVISVDINRNIIFLNQVAEGITGWAQAEALGKPVYTIFNIINEFTRKMGVDIVDEVMSSGKIHQLEDHTILISKDGGEIFIEDSAAPILNEEKKTIGVVIVFRDFTEKWDRLKKIEYLSFHDELTGLYNRRFYEEEIKRLDTGRNLPLSLIIGDVNGLKLINDSFGHEVGDELLRKAASAIAQGCRSGDIVARLGGDEFVIALPNSNADDVKEVIARIKNLLLLETVNELEVSISFGSETKTDEKQLFRDIFKSTEDNMYRHKIYESSSIRSETINLITRTLYAKNTREMIHSKKVSELCEAISEKLGFTKEDINLMKLAGLMHDIGKIGIPDEILNKTGTLNNAEYNEMKKHPEIVYRILSSVNEFSEISDFVLEHQEKWDGTGYPQGLKGNEIKKEARIIAIADAYDAMTTQRSYREALSQEDALNEIKKYSGTQFDPEIAKVFLEQVMV